MLLTLQSWFVLIGSSSRKEGIEEQETRGIAKGGGESAFQERMGVVYPDRGWEMRVEEMGGGVDPNFSPLPPAHRRNAAVGGLV